MDKLIAVLIAGVILFLAFILSTVLGGIAGWVVGGVFPYVTDTIRELAGVSLTDFQLGATLGFLSGFLKTTVSND